METVALEILFRQLRLMIVAWREIGLANLKPLLPLFCSTGTQAI